MEMYYWNKLSLFFNIYLRLFYGYFRSLNQQISSELVSEMLIKTVLVFLACNSKLHNQRCVTNENSPFRGHKMVFI